MSALRTLARHRGYATLVAATLAAGLACALATFAVVYAALWKPLPYPDSQRLVALGKRGFTPTQFAALRDTNRTLEAVAALKSSVTDQEFDATAGGTPKHVTAIHATASLFSLLGVTPFAGRTFLDTDDRTGAPAVTLISHDLWRRLFSRDPAAIGRTLRLDGVPYTVIGILPPSFRYSPNLEPPDLWLPLLPFLHDNRPSLEAIARLRPGVIPAQAAADLHLDVTPLLDHIAGSARRPLVPLLGAVVFVFLIACANVALLSLARAEHRTRELAIRTALGATPARLLRDAIAEHLVLAVCAGLLACLPAIALLRALVPLLPPEIPRTREIALSGIALLAALPAMLAAGLAPAFAPRLGRLRNALVVAEVALAVVLLTGAGLMLRTLSAMLRVDPGFNAHNVTALDLHSGYRTALQRAQSTPGVIAAALVAPLPLTRNGFISTLRLEDRTTTDRVSMRVVSEDYFQLMGIPLRRGRALTSHDSASNALITETMARRYWPQTDPLGRQVLLPNFDPGRWLTIVGVVADVHDGWLLRDSLPQVYVPFETKPIPWVSLVIRTAPGANLRPSLDPAYNLRSLEQVIDTWYAPQRFSLRLLAAFAAIALLLTAAGLYGVIAYTVTRRTREIGIRIAIGARPAAVLRQVLARALVLATAGVALGVAAALYLTRFLATQLYGVHPLDPSTFVAVTLILLAVTLAAACAPARRAARIDPAIALRID